MQALGPMLKVSAEKGWLLYGNEMEGSKSFIDLNVSVMKLQSFGANASIDPELTLMFLLSSSQQATYVSQS